MKPTPIEEEKGLLESPDKNDTSLELAEADPDLDPSKKRPEFPYQLRLSGANLPVRLSSKAMVRQELGLDVRERDEEGQEEAAETGESSGGGLRYLKYGDKIKLRINGGGGNGAFYMYSDGFAMKRIYLRQTGTDGRRKERTVEEFRVMPRSNSEALTQLRQDLKQVMRNKKASSGSVSGRLPPLAANDCDLNRIIDEIELNQKKYAQLIGQPVHYYESIQLIHEETQQYVSVSKNVELSPKDIGKDEGQGETQLKVLLDDGIKKDIMRVYSMKLEPYSCATTHFVLVPCHRYQEAGYILEEDFFYLAYADTKLLGKFFHLYFPQADILPSSAAAMGVAKAHVAYLYDEIKTSVKFESVPDRCAGHLFRELNRKAVWITHIEAPLLLCLEKLEKATEQEGNELGELIEPAGEAVSQSFSLSFKPYDSEAPLSCNGLWIVVAKPQDKRQVIFKHLLYALLYYLP